MKKLTEQHLKDFILLIMIMIVMFFTACIRSSSKPDKINYQEICIKAYFIDGHTRNIKVNIPENTTLIIGMTSDGYSLEYDEDPNSSYGQVIRIGVTDFEYINCN